MLAYWICNIYSTIVHNLSGKSFLESLHSSQYNDTYTSAECLNTGKRFPLCLSIHGPDDPNNCCREEYCHILATIHYPSKCNIFQFFSIYQRIHTPCKLSTLTICAGRGYYWMHLMLTSQSKAIKYTMHIHILRLGYVDVVHIHIECASSSIRVSFCMPMPDRIYCP